MTIPIAIIGMSCRFPGDATSPEKLFRMCMESRAACTRIDEERINTNGFYHPDAKRSGATYVQNGHFLKQDLGTFDAPFFNITSEEAAAMDPQQRLILECSYEAFENAGIPAKDITGSETSVFVGSFNGDWTDTLNRDIEALPLYQATGTGKAMLANRLSYFYDLKGPSVSIDTACSSSLVAIHLACQSLRTGESTASIIGGSTIILSPEGMSSMSRMRFLSPDGRSFAYDSRANGYGRGEGAACIILKPLNKAIEDGDTIRAIIRNTGTNQDGRTHGITLPSREAQEFLIRKVHDAIGLDPSETPYVEAHGTGTAVGDPLEAQALSNVFTRERSSGNPLFVGSVKTNIGHLEGCSGLAGLIKTVSMLENNLILPNANFEQANEQIPLSSLKLKVPTSVHDWPSLSARRASISNFGYGGSNAHVIVESASSYFAAQSICTSPASSFQHETTSSKSRVFELSAHSEISATQQARDLATYLQERGAHFGPDKIDDLAFTLSCRRSSLPWKVAVQANSISQLIEKLTSPDLKHTKLKKTPRLGFIFTGQGAQWYAMGRELIDVYPVFRNSLMKSNCYLQGLGATWSLVDELLKSSNDSNMSLGFLSQSCCTALQIALIDLLCDWSILLSSVTGHSSGEIAAAYAAGALSQQSALAIAYFRGLAGSAIKEKYPSRTGSMLAAGLSKEEVQKSIETLIKGQVVVACVNSPSSVTISGDDPAIMELLGILQSENIFARKINVDIAYHSHHMFCIAEDYLNALGTVHVKDSGHISFYSSVTGQALATSKLNAAYWAKNMTSPVLFSDSVRELCYGIPSGAPTRSFHPNVDMLIEVGPASALQGPIKQILEADIVLQRMHIESTSMLIRNVDAVQTSLQLVSNLCRVGYPVDLSIINDPSKTSRHQVLVDLPPYPWNHSKSYWAESRLSRNVRTRTHPRTDILGARVADWNPLEPRWRNYLRPSENPSLRDHRIQDTIIYPAGGYIVMAIEAVCRYATIIE